MAWSTRSAASSPGKLIVANDVSTPGGMVRSASVVGLGSAAPARVVTNQDLEQSLETSDAWIVERTGIRERRVAEAHEATSDFAIAAARRALEDAAFEPRDLDLVICATVTPDYPFPAVASQVQHALGAPRAAAFDLAAGCAGFIYALATGAQFIASGTMDHVLIVGAETLSRIINWEDRTTCVLFGDGAGAVLLTPAAPGEGILSFDMGSDGSGVEMLYVPAGGSRRPASRETVENREHTLHMAGREVFRWAIQIVEESTLNALRRAELGIRDVDWFIFHQANQRIIEAAVKRLGIPPERVVVNVDRYGNTSSASIPLALEDARQAKQLRPGDLVALVGFGAGLTWATSIMRWGAPEKRE